MRLDEAGHQGAAAAIDHLDAGLVDGDPLSDLKLFQDHDRILMIMKDGQFHKRPVPRGDRSERIAA